MSQVNHNLDLGLIGNCSYGALIDKSARVVWACMPQFDSNPVFSSLLNPPGDDEDGCFAIEVHDVVESEQRYIHNTPVLVTVLRDRHDNEVEVTDFAPRFRQHGRMFRPIMMIRRVKPLKGSPRIRIRLRPNYDYGASQPQITRGSNHIRYVTPDWVLRLTTDCSVSAILDENQFVLNDGITLILGPDETLPEAVTPVGHQFMENTLDYWRDWVRTLAIPFEWQQQVIRAAITLKLNAYEDTGAIIAALTTSIPESPNSGRNWDYRYCWLRDGYFVISALNRLGTTVTMESFLRYLINVSAGSDGNHLWPVYRINGKRDLAEAVVEHLKGYRGMGPVRIGNQACEQIQNDVYGAAILATAHVFFDERLARPGDEALFNILEGLGRRATEVYDQPDAGVWEFRQGKRIHTYSSVMCWVACDRLAKIAAHLNLDRRQKYWRGQADKMRKHIMEKAWNGKMNSFVASFDGAELDSSLLLLHELGFIEAEDPRFAGTVEAIEAGLREGDFLFRYRGEDDFGKPESAFTVCTFWYIDALTSLGRVEEARELFLRLLQCCNHLGLLSEDINPETRELWGNYPQTYSMVGIINSAIRLSKPWSEAF
ncbi:MAG: glycoside hydrolase family 15 protein [Gammaproteobacteria bacterium]|jgi:GH15 family glucan-1,4-alpha-glucosidase